MLDKFERVENPNGRKRLHCSHCKRLTIHNLEAQCKGSWDDPINADGGGYIYSIYRCGACDEVGYETISWSINDVEHDDDGYPEPVEHAVQYPAPVSAHFNFNIEYTPSKLDAILDEMLYALAGTKTILATIGLRLAIEFIVNDKKCAGKNLQQKIDDLRKQDVIDDDQKSLLHRIRELGNTGAHEAVGMDARELVAGMSIIEGLLEKLYNGPARHQEIIRKAKRLLRIETPKED